MPHSRYFSQQDIDNASCNGKLIIDLLYRSFINQEKIRYQHFVWNKMSVPKHRFICWQIVNDKLLACDHLQWVLMQLDSYLCPVCEKADENHSHLIFNCDFSQQVVIQIHAWMGCNWPLLYRDWTSWIEDMNKNVKAKLVATKSSTFRTKSIVTGQKTDPTRTFNIHTSIGIQSET
ncbi:hypothetical protein CsatA_024702 [Cannabis sativa]